MRASRIPALDGFRGWAALGIVTLHVLGLSVILTGNGSAIETILDGTIGQVLGAFFIISGFGLFYGVVMREGELGGVGSFYRRRFARIYPAYWLCLTVVLIAAIIYLPPLARYPSATDLLLEYSGLQMPARVIDSTVDIGFGVDTAFWFVSVILAFYLVFPLIARPYYRHPWLGLLAAAVISIAWKEGAAHLSGVFGAIQSQAIPYPTDKLIVIDQFPGWAFSFATGMTAASVYARLRATRTEAELGRMAVRAAPLALAALALAIYLFGHLGASVSGALSPTFARESAIVPVIWSAAVGAAMLVVLIGPRWMQLPFVNRPIRWLGELSYGIFLIQAAILVYVVVAFPGWTTNTSPVPVALLYVFVLGLSILYAMASRRFVELPVAEWAARREQRREGDRQVAEAPVRHDPDRSGAVL